MPLPTISDVRRDLQDCMYAQFKKNLYLQTMNWAAFMATPYPPSTPVAAYLTDAFCHLSIKANGDWDYNDGVLMAFIQCMKGLLDRPPSNNDWLRLVFYLKAQPVDQSRITEWFNNYFPEQ